MTMVLLAGQACARSPSPSAHHAEPIRTLAGRASPSGRVEASSFRMATFNAGLARGVLAYAAERAPRVAERLERLPVELLCVQEFWFDADWERLVIATETTLRHRLRPPPVATSAATRCAPDELEPVLGCAYEHCDPTSATAFAACAASHCGHLARELSTGCVACLTRDPLRPVAEILSACVPGEEAAEAGDPPDDAPVYVYDGSYGIGLLTSASILEEELLTFESVQHPRGAIYAKVATEVVGTLHVFCTHLTPVMDLPYPGSGSWLAEQEEQVEALLSWIDEKAAPGEAVALLGDFNTGPGVGERIHGRAVGHYARFLAGGFENPFLAEPRARCTYCFDNPIVGGSGGDGVLIDHVLLRGFGGPVSATRVLDDRIVLDLARGRVRASYSDHYAILVTLRVR